MPGAVIGRFQPLHDSQVDLIEYVKEREDELYIGIIGTEPCRENPLSHGERTYPLKRLFPEAKIARFGNENMKFDSLERHHQFLVNFPTYREDIREEFSRDVTIYTGDETQARVYRMMGFDVEHTGRGEIDGSDVRELLEEIYIEGEDEAYEELEQMVPEESLEVIEEVLPSRYEKLETRERANSSIFTNLEDLDEIDIDETVEGVYEILKEMKNGIMNELKK